MHTHKDWQKGLGLSALRLPEARKWGDVFDYRLTDLADCPSNQGNPNPPFFPPPPFSPPFFHLERVSSFVVFSCPFVGKGKGNESVAIKLGINSSHDCRHAHGWAGNGHGWRSRWQRDSLNPHLTQSLRVPSPRN